MSGLAECRRGGTGMRAEEPRRLRCGTCVPTAPISAEHRVSRLPCRSWARPAAHFITPLALPWPSCLVTGQLIHPVPWALRAGRGRSWRQADALDRRLALPQLAVRSTAVRCFWRRSIQSTARWTLRTRSLRWTCAGVSAVSAPERAGRRRVLRYSRRRAQRGPAVDDRVWP
jgi:hypothetical protein